MVTTVFESIAARAEALRIDSSDQAKTWYRDQAASVKRINENRIFDMKNARSSLTAQNIGQMFMFFYDPKNKATLPYYDRFPLVFPVEIYGDGFLGINLHYLPRKLRANLMDALYATLNNKRSNDTTRLRLSYDLLKNTTRMRYFKPCLKKYLSKHVKQRFMYIDPKDWDKALMLPTERFMKKPVNQVRSASVKMINGQK